MWVVLCGYTETYKTYAGWKQNDITDDCVIVSVENNDTTLGTVVGGLICSPNTPITLYALPTAGNTFVGWADGIIDNPREVVSINEDITFTAIFSTKDTVTLHDTTIVVDTLIQYVDVHDTTYVDVPYAVYDTTYIDVPYAVHDTTIITLADTITNTVFNTITNTFYDTIYSIITDTLWLTDTVYLHDTIYITEERIDDAQALNAMIYSSEGRIVVDGVEGERVRLFDAVGRQVAVRRESSGRVLFDVPASGVYLVKIGSYAPRRVVVVR